MVVRCQNAPTWFGRAGYEIRSAVDSGIIEAIVNPPTTRPSGRIVLRIRHPQGKPIKSVTVNGRNHSDCDAAAETINVKPDGKQITIRVEY